LDSNFVPLIKLKEIFYHLIQVQVPLDWKQMENWCWHIWFGWETHV